jgi:hypothetical protein
MVGFYVVGFSTRQFEPGFLFYLFMLDCCLGIWVCWVCSFYLLARLLKLLGLAWNFQMTVCSSLAPLSTISWPV